MREEFLWVERYRPQEVATTILPPDLQTTFQTFVNKKSIPNLLLVGGPGMGKTTVAKAMCRELNADHIVINGSMKGNIDTLRNDIFNFASTISLFGGRKYVILDEADYLNAQSTQPALRNFMEEFSTNCGFILTANYLNKIIEPLHSRCSVIEFKFLKKDIPHLAKALFTQVTNILGNEGVEFEKAVVAQVIQQHFPDFRRIINDLQRYGACGKIDSGILAFRGGDISPLIEFVKQKNFTDARMWISQNVDNSIEFFRTFYEYTKTVKPNVAPALVLLLGKYQYQDSFVANKEINVAAFVAEVMLEGIYD